MEGTKVRFAVFTMAYNEGIILPLWVNYYGRIFGRESLYIFDHGSDDGSTLGLEGVNIIPLPRTPFSDIKRSHLISDTCKNFLNFFDYFIYTDTDEFLCVDPQRHNNLKTYLEDCQPDYETSIGLNLFHSFDDEAEINLARPILAQRNYAYFLAAMCKTHITRIPTKWGGGFHDCDHPQRFGEVYNIHLKQMDRNVALDRLRFLRNITREGIFGNHQMIQDAEMKKIFFQINTRQRVDDFDFAPQTAEIMSRVKENHAKMFAFDVDYKPSHPPHLRFIPEQFKGVF